MPHSQILHTERLRLEPYCAAHVDHIHAMNSDPAVMRFISQPQSRAEAEANVAMNAARWETYGFGWWAVFERSTDRFLGGACLQHLAHIDSNPLEVGWRFLTTAQGQGYATEAGRAAIEYGFGVVGADRLLAVANPENTASLRVMERLAMTSIGLQTHYGERCATYEILKT